MTSLTFPLRFCFWLKDHSLFDYKAGTSDLAKWSREFLCMTFPSLKTIRACWGSP